MFITSRQDEAFAFADLRTVAPILGPTPTLQTNEISGQQSSSMPPGHFQGLDAALGRYWALG